METKEKKIEISDSMKEIISSMTCMAAEATIMKILMGLLPKEAKLFCRLAYAVGGMCISLVVADAVKRYTEKKLDELEGDVNSVLEDFDEISETLDSSKKVVYHQYVNGKYLYSKDPKELYDKWQELLHQ